MKNLFPNICGNDKLKNRVGIEIIENRFSHAFIIEGVRGAGKHTLALQIAAAIFCEKRLDGELPLPCGKCPACESILSRKSSDIIFIGREPDKATISVEQIRSLKSDIIVAPNVLDGKIYIIENSELMGPGAQNALLKMLEEPPEYVTFLLLCENSDSLLDTVRSRAPTLRLERHTPQVMSDYIIKNSSAGARMYKNNAKKFSDVIMSAGGSIGRALEMLGNDDDDLICHNQAAEFIDMLLKRKNKLDFLSAVSQLGEKRVEIQKVMQYISTALRDLIIMKRAEKTSLCFFGDEAEAREIAAMFTLAKLMKLFDCVNELIDSMQLNANISLSLLVFGQSAWKTIH